MSFPRTKEEAKAMQRVGVLPTHTLEFIHDPKDYKEKDLWNINLSQWNPDEFRSMMAEYKRRARDLRELFKSSYKRVVIRGRPIELLVNKCRLLLRRMPFKGSPLLPRVVIIGIKGSKKTTIANMLHKKFKLVHVNFWNLLSKVSAVDDFLGKEIKKTQESISIDICLQVLENRLLEDDCLNYGWVLTGFPRDETDFKYLDHLDVPPNRIIFFRISKEKCMERLSDRRINVFNGKVMSWKSNCNDSRMQEQLAVHPVDALQNVEIEQEAFLSEVTGMLEYCEHRAVIINASKPVHEVFEKVELFITSPEAYPKRRKTETAISLYNFFSDNALT